MGIVLALFLFHIKKIEIVKGEYNLPQKWKNFHHSDKEMVDGVMVSNDYRNGEVKIYLFKI